MLLSFFLTLKFLDDYLRVLERLHCDGSHLFYCGWTLIDCKSNLSLLRSKSLEAWLPEILKLIVNVIYGIALPWLKRLLESESLSQVDFRFFLHLYNEFMVIFSIVKR